MLTFLVNFLKTNNKCGVNIKTWIFSLRFIEGNVPYTLVAKNSSINFMSQIKKNTLILLIFKNRVFTFIKGFYLRVKTGLYFVY